MALRLDQLDDGDTLDVAIAQELGNAMGLLLGDGLGGLGSLTSYPTGAGPNQLVIVDFDGDGSRDALTSNGGDDTISFLRRTGIGFQAPVAHPGGVGPHRPLGG